MPTGRPPDAVSLRAKERILAGESATSVAWDMRIKVTKITRQKWYKEHKNNAGKPATTKKGE